MEKGELPEETECYIRVNGDICLGSIRYKNGCHNKKLPYVKSFNGQFITKYVEEVLAPVPSYEEWQASEKYNKHLEEVIKIYERKDKQATETSITYNELTEENTKLKELLKECKERLIYCTISTQDVQAKINQVLGE